MILTGVALSEPVIVKVGGSVITDKTSEAPVIRHGVIRRVAKELAELHHDGTRLIIIHGVGSTGHPPVKKYGLHKGFRDPSQLIGYAIAQNRVNRLRQALLDALEAEGVPAIEFYPSSFVVSRAGRIVRMYAEPLTHLFKLGVVPVLSGDLVADLEMGFSVCSGDQLAFELAEALGSKLIIFGVDVDGVFTSDPKKGGGELIPVIHYGELERLLSGVGGAAGIDVSGGMRGKLREALLHRSFFERGGEVWLLNLLEHGRLIKAVRGEEGTPMTRIVL